MLYVTFAAVHSRSMHTAHVSIYTVRYLLFMTKTGYKFNIPLYGSIYNNSTLGHLRTVRLAAVEVTEPAALLTTHRYIPESLSATAAMVYMAEVAPATFVPFFCHWYMRLVSMAVTVKVAGCPGTTNVSETGWTVIMGGFTTERGKD